MCDKENLKPPLVARQNTSRLPVPVRKKQSHYYKADAISAVELPLSTTLKAPHRKQQSTSKSLGKGKPDAQQTPRELLLTTILEEWRSRMHIKITDRHMLVSASAVDRQRLISHAFHQWSIARRQQQLDRLQLLKSDRFRKHYFCSAYLPKLTYLHMYTAYRCKVHSAFGFQGLAKIKYSTGLSSKLSTGHVAAD
jgi:hypothetical protein